MAAAGELKEGIGPPRAGGWQLVSASLLVGATFGAGEAAWVLCFEHSVRAVDVTLLFLYGCAGYALAAAAVATGVVIGQRLLGRSRGTVGGTVRFSDAVAIVVSITVSARMLSALAHLGRPKLAWLIPGCILTGVAVGWVARWLTARIPLLHRSATWWGLSAAGLAIGLAGAGLTGERGALTWYVAGVSAGLVLVFAPLLWRVPVSYRWPRGGVVTLWLFAAIAVMPFGVAALQRLRPVPLPANPARLNVLLISVDTLRRDRLGCYGFAHAHTPNIDALAGAGVLFEEVLSPVPLTGPSHTTMLTGVYPVHHGAYANGVALRDDVVTLPEILAHAGYRTAAFVSGYTLRNVSLGLASRFHHYDEDFALWPPLPDVVLLNLSLPHLAAQSSRALGYPIEQVQRRGLRTTERALAWLSRHRDHSFFAFVHYFDAHGPHVAPPPYDRMFAPNDPPQADESEFYFNRPVRLRLVSSPKGIAHLTNMYDGEIAYADEQVGRLLSGLEALGLADNTLVIFTADHGESLTEHDFFFDHGEYLYETCVRVPLIIRFPDRRYAQIRKTGQVRLVDLTPTILQLLGIKSPVSFDGKSLVPILEGSEPPGQRVSFGTIRLGEGEDVRSRFYVRQDGYKLIWNLDRREEASTRPAVEELYDLTRDPDELHNVIAQAPPALEPLRSRLQAWVQEKAEPASALSDSVKERLRALGY